MRARFPLICLATACALFSLRAPAASVILDSNFHPPGFSLPLPSVRTLLLADGKFLLFFGNDTLSDRAAGAITRFLPDGSVDSFFHSVAITNTW